MTQLVVTLDKDADGNLIKKMIEGMKGVIAASFRSKSANSKDAEEEEWIRNVNSLSNSVDPSWIDMSDERTRYIMSK